MVMSLRPKWAAGKALRAGLALEGASRTIFALGGEAQISRTAKMVRDARRSRLEKQPTDLRRHHHYMRDGTLESLLLVGVALLISSCTSGPDLPSASDSALPSPPSDSAPLAPESGESAPLVRPGDIPATSDQSQ